MEESECFVARSEQRCVDFCVSVSVLCGIEEKKREGRGEKSKVDLQLVDVFLATAHGKADTTQSAPKKKKKSILHGDGLHSTLSLSLTPLHHITSLITSITTPTYHLYSLSPKTQHL